MTCTVHRPLPEPVEIGPFRDEDFDAVRALLVETACITPPGFNWEVRRLDGSRFHGDPPIFEDEFLDGSAIWRTSSGRVVAAIHPEDRGEVFIQIHPDFRSLEPVMIEHAKRHLSISVKDSPVDGSSCGGSAHQERRALFMEAYDYDVLRQRYLAEAGFVRQDYRIALRNLRIGLGVFNTPRPVDEYGIRTADPHDTTDCERIASLLNAAFNRDFHQGIDYRNFALNAPSYRRDLDLVAVSADGTFAAYVGIPYDPANRLGIFEPVCTHPQHRRRGLAQMLMMEGLHRLAALGARSVMAGTGNAAAANALYESIGFTETHLGSVWRWEG